MALFWRGTSETSQMRNGFVRIMNFDRIADVSFLNVELWVAGPVWLNICIFAQTYSSLKRSQSLRWTQTVSRRHEFRRKCSMDWCLREARYGYCGARRKLSNRFFAWSDTNIVWVLNRRQIKWLTLWIYFTFTVWLETVE